MAAPRLRLDPRRPEWRCLRCAQPLPAASLAGSVTYYVSRRGLRWPLHAHCVDATWVPVDGGWTFPTNVLTVEVERVVWGCGCWRDLQGRPHRRPAGCAFIHRAVSRWPPVLPM